MYEVGPSTAGDRGRPVLEYTCDLERIHSTAKLQRSIAIDKSVDNYDIKSLTPHLLARRPTYLWGVR